MTQNQLAVYVLSGFFGICILVILFGLIRNRQKDKTEKPTMTPGEYQANLEELKQGLKGVVKGWIEMPPEEKARFWGLLNGTEKASHPAEQALQSIGKFVTPKRIVTAKGRVVLYRVNEDPTDILMGFFRTDSIEQQIRDILTADPNIDLAQFESVLGIKILNSSRASLPDNQDNELGEIE